MAFKGGACTCPKSIAESSSSSTSPTTALQSSTQMCAQWKHAMCEWARKRSVRMQHTCTSRRTLICTWGSKLVNITDLPHPNHQLTHYLLGSGTILGPVLQRQTWWRTRVPGSLPRWGWWPGRSPSKHPVQARQRALVGLVCMHACTHMRKLYEETCGHLHPLMHNWLMFILKIACQDTYLHIHVSMAHLNAGTHSNEHVHMCKDKENIQLSSGKAGVSFCVRQGMHVIRRRVCTCVRVFVCYTPTYH